MHLPPKHESSSEPGFILDENKSLCLFLALHGLYLRLNGAITFAGESHRACHNDTQDMASPLALHCCPDHNDTAVLYLVTLGKKHGMRRSP